MNEARKCSLTIGRNFSENIHYLFDLVCLFVCLSLNCWTQFEWLCKHSAYTHIWPGNNKNLVINNHFLSIGIESINK